MTKGFTHFKKNTKSRANPYLELTVERRSNHLSTISDEQLLAAYRAGDESAFAELVHRYEKELYNFLMRFLGSASLAEDVFQETFLQVHVAVESFQTDRRFRPWLYTIAANKARDFLRSRSRRPTVQLTVADDQGSEGQLWDILVRDDVTPVDIFEQKQQKDQVRRVVAQMPVHLREILLLAYFQQLSYKDMSEALEIPLGTVKSRLHAAVKQFAKQYKQAEPPSENES